MPTGRQARIADFRSGRKNTEQMNKEQGTEEQMNKEQGTEEQMNKEQETEEQMNKDQVIKEYFQRLVPSDK